MRKLILVLTFTCFAALAPAQTDQFQRNHVTIGIGPAIPVGNTANYLSTAPLLSVGYGYRFTRFLQADVGFQVAFGAANNNNGELTDFGQVQGGDHEYMIPLGGRFIIPNPFKRMEFSVGGGAVYLHYSETIPSSGDFSSTCYTCSSRGGWGGYGLANASYFLGDSHTFHVGTTFEFIAASTSGQSVGNVPGIQTRDHWSNLSLEFGLSF
jgi:hypothetical protein